MTSAMAATRQAPPADADDAAPQRRCLVTGAVLPKAALVRFVAAPDATVVPDVAGRLPGRGMWTVARRDAVVAAANKNLFGRAARCSLQPLDGLADVVEGQLAQRCIELLGLARRAGGAVLGFEEVRAWLRAQAGGPGHGLLITAADAAADGRAKLALLATRATPGIGRVETLTAAELGRAWGRERVVHAVIRPGSLAVRLASEAARLSGFRGAAAAL